MKERQANVKCHEVLTRDLLGCKIIKHADRFTSGIPDTSVSWKGATSWLEFKMLKPSENVHCQLDQIQLVTCVELERTTQRCWIVCFKKGKGREQGMTYIYRPSKLLRGEIPTGRVWSGQDDSVALWLNGVIAYEGFNYGAVAQLVRLTHETHPSL